MTDRGAFCCAMQWGGVRAASSKTISNKQQQILGVLTMENKPIAQHKIDQFIDSTLVIDELAKEKPDIAKLKSYKGFGGLKRCFWDKKLYGRLMAAIRNNFGKERERDILESLRNSSSSAYYTPPELVKFIYRYLEQVCNFKGGDILEPSCGNGVFFEYMPDGIRKNSTITGIEFDTVTGKLVKTIYPEINIINDGLQNIGFKSKKYDLIIGNPPYGKEKMIDAIMPDLDGYTIHHYFVAKCARLLKDGGIMALVVPSFYMDIPKAHTRHIIDNEAVFIDAVRLPDNLFEQANVSVDIIFIRKTGRKIHSILESRKFTQGNASEFVNKFWFDNPNRIFGQLKLKWVEAYKRFVPSCYAENKEQVLQYLDICEFTKSTIENYNRIVDNADSTPKILFAIFDEIADLETLAAELIKRISVLNQKTNMLIDIIPCPED